MDYRYYKDTVKDQFNDLFEEYEDRCSGSGSGNCSGGGNDVIQEGFMREEAGPGSGQ